MTKMQRQVEEFHRRLGQPIGSGPPHFSREELRAKLILEEAIETAVGLVGSMRMDVLLGQLRREHAFKDPSIQNMPDAIDGLCDLLYVAFGAAVEMGVDLEPFFDEVHKTNLAKLNGPIRADGKVQKPEGWKPPRIAEMLRELGWNS